MYREWEVTVNREEITGEVHEAVFKNTKIGVQFTYGMRPEGYDGVVISERGGGGSVSIPWMKDPDTGCIYIGLVQEKRSTLGSKTWNVPRGFLDLGEGHDQAATRELSEETGYVAFASRTTQLTDGLNPNSAYFNTSGTNPDGTRQGVAIYGIEVRRDELEMATTEEGFVSYVFSKATKDSVKDEVNEHITSTRFVPLSHAIKSKDMFTSAAAGQLLVALYDGTLDKDPDKIASESLKSVALFERIPKLALQETLVGINDFTEQYAR